MGKGRIITDHGEGSYTIELLEDRTRAEASRALAVQRVAALDTRISELEADLAAAQVDVDAAADTQDQAIAAYQAALGDDQIDTAEARAAMVAAGEAVIQAAAKRDAIAGNLRALKIERLALQRRIDRIDALPALRQQQAWCADLTESLAGEVGTAEVPGQATQVLVHPGHEGAAVYDQARDGALQPALSGTPAGVFYNLAMLPGWQKWRPTYRIATITSLSISTDSCDIDIEPATSSEQGLNVNAAANYAGVPIQYMTCHANAFEVGDRVLVRFDRQDQSPTVIGFESNPRGCGIDTVVAVPITLLYNDDFPYSIGGSCACGETVPTPGRIYTARATIDYVWRLDFAGGVEVFEEGKLAQALNATDATGLPAPDQTVTEEHEILSLYRTAATYPYEFPVSDGAGGCTTETDSFSRLAISDDTPEIGGGAPFFNGELGIRDNGSQASITLDGEAFTVAYDPEITQQEWHSLESGIYTVSDDGAGSCSALYLLSKDREAATSYDSFFPLGLTAFSELRTLPALTIAGKEKRPLGVFGLIPGENTFIVDNETFPINGVTRVFTRQFQRKLYLLVGYGR